MNTTVSALEASYSSHHHALRPGMNIGESGILFIGGCDTVELARTYGTPLFVYDEQLLRSTIRALHRAFVTAACKYEITYASKAFCTIAMCQLAYQEGCSIDVVSGGELYTALVAGVAPDRIHFHGNNKTEQELIYAVSNDVGIFVVDNLRELVLLNDIARQQGKTVNIVLRISPGVSAHTHEYISTGQQDSKFGFDLESGQAHQVLYSLGEYSGLRCIGLHAHIGSQIFERDGFALSIERLAEVYVDGLRVGLPFSVFNVGGGFGIRYTREDEPTDVAELIAGIVDEVRRAFLPHDVELPVIWIEPGRSIAGPAGTTLYEVGSRKQIPEIRNYLAVDGGMTDNPRLALYGAKYEAILANRANEETTGVWSIAGKCCESGDVVVWDAPLPDPVAGDILAVFATGAYNYSMASHYNRIPKPAVVFVHDGVAKVVVERETWADVARMDRPL